MKILLADSIDPLFIERMTNAGFHCDDASQWSSEKIAEVIQDYQGLVVRNKLMVDRRLLKKARKLQFVARAGSGMERIDQKEANLRNIICLNAPEGNRQAVAEHVLAMLLNLLRNICLADHQVRNMQWHREALRGEELQGKTVAIIGFGNTGSTLARLLHPFKVKILALDKYVRINRDEYPFVDQVEWPVIFDQADVVSLHIPLTEETRGMVNESFFASFKKPIYFINVARGPIVVSRAIIHALNNGMVKGACLDVFDFENDSFDSIQTEANPELDFLRSCNRVILTPHIAGLTKESHRKIAMVLADKILALFKPVV
jgi:D-3-phosphoglycerate dehydrogenase